MKAAVLKDKRKMVVEEVPDPKAGPGEILLKMKYVGICGSDLHLYATGLLPPDVIMGHECAGVVLEVGEGVEGWQPGDRAAIHGGLSCGECFWCRMGRSNICREMGGIGLGDMPGGYAELLKVFPEQMVRLPEEVSLKDAALLDPFSTAMHAIKLSGFQKHETALVMGAGPIGLCIIQELKLAAPKLLAATELVPNRARAASDFGADPVLKPDDDVMDKLAELTDDVGPDYVFECVGIPETTSEAFNLVRRAGKVVLVGVCMEPTPLVPVFWMIKELSMQTTMGFSREEFLQSLEMLRQGAFRTDGLVSETIPLDRLPETFERLLKPNQEIKVLVEYPD
ncbi:MAG: (R,R)-butanediol dehydrogenase [Candidatus Abyssubacteria bacterium]